MVEAPKPKYLCGEVQTTPGADPTLPFLAGCASVLMNVEVSLLLLENQMRKKLEKKCQKSGKVEITQKYLYI